MLVKIIAMGLSPAIWKNVFHHLRNSLPDHPFAAGIFSTDGEIAYLTGEFFPHQWQREGVDFLFCEAPAGADWKKRQPFLKRLAGREVFPAPELVLTLSTLEHGIKQLIQAHGPVQVEVEHKTRFLLNDPAFIIRGFPRAFPRLQVNGYLSALRVRRRDGKIREVAPAALPANSLLGFSELESVIHGGEAQVPQEWLREVLKSEQVKLPRGGCPGLIHEAKGLFLFPGIPMHRLSGATVEGVAFRHLLDLGQLSANSGHFAGVQDALRQSAERHGRQWDEAARLIHMAESKTDLPVVCGGGLPLVRETLAALLTARGFARVTPLERLADDIFREPVLVLQTGGWADGKPGAQVEDPLVVSLADELERVLVPLDGMLDWRALPYQPRARPEIPLSSKTFGQQRESLDARGNKAADGHALTEKRMLLLEQEQEVLAAAGAKLEELLGAGEALQVWSGRLPGGVKQVLVFSHDPEEAGAVLQALPGIAKKRWFDLSPYTEPDALRGLSLEPVRHYLEGGLLVITAASRERLKALQTQIAGQAGETARGLEEAREALAFYREEEQKTAAAREELARQWVVDALDDWLERNTGALMEQVEVLRQRHERRWLAPALIHRVVIIPSSGENQEPLVAACRAVFPGFRLEHSPVVHYEYKQQHRLSPAERKALRGLEGNRGLGAEALRGKEEELLFERNRVMLEDFLQVIAHELAEAKAELVLIEQERETAFAILEHLRANRPQLADVPAVLILPEAWSPREHQSMPWPRTRVILLRRLGALTAEECRTQLQALFPP